MIKKVIKCSGKYLGNSMDKFPFANKGEILFFDKGRTGCGGTTFAGKTALGDNDIKVVVGMPSVAVVMSKEGQSEFKGNPEMQFLYGNKRLCGLPRIIFCTYDKVKSVIKALGSEAKEYNLLIDEYHIVVRDAEYRSVMFDLISNLDMWESVTMMSATPDQYLEDAVEKMYPCRSRKIQVIWKNHVKVIAITEVDNVIGSLCLLINRCLKGELENNCNLYLFFNNIAGCVKLIERCGLKTGSYHFLCSSSAKTIPDRSTIVQINKEPRKVNFITSAGFEGTDILDNNAQPVIVIDMSSPSTIFDAETLEQVAGRCRKASGEPQILYKSTKGYRRDMLLPVQLKSEHLHSLIREGKATSPFEEAQLAHDKEILNNMQSLEAVKKYLKKHGYTVLEFEQTLPSPKPNGKRVPIKKLCEMYNEGYDITGYHNSILVKNAMKELGMSMIEKLDFKSTSMKRALKIRGMNGYDKPVDSIMGLQIGATYSSAQIRGRIEDANKILGTDFDTTHLVVTLNEMGYMVKEHRSSNKLEYIVLNTSTKMRHSRHDHYITHVNNISFLDLTISIAKNFGSKSTWMTKEKMYSVYYLYSEGVPQKKEDQIYISGCYSLTERSYRRLQGSYDACDIMILDVDNKEDKDECINIDDFNDYMARYFGNALHYIYTTFSHDEKSGKDKYRVIIPLSHTLILKRYEDGITSDESIRAYKKIKATLFPGIQDPNCPLWVYAPASEIKEYGDRSVVLNADYLSDWIEEFVIIERALNSLSTGGVRAVFTPEQEAQAIQNEREKYLKSRLTADKVIDIINNAQVGERDNTIFRMAMVNLDSADVDKVRAGIHDPEKLKMYNEKLTRRRLYCHD